LESGHPKVMDLGEKAVEISDDVWIGSHAIILRGVNLGRGCVVAAGSVVTKSVPEFTLVAGNPARIIRTVEKPPPEFPTANS
jgi:acetyltransferase-like isoleucine patch superfamily enzyme